MPAEEDVLNTADDVSNLDEVAASECSMEMEEENYGAESSILLTEEDSQALISATEISTTRRLGEDDVN